MGNYSDLGLRDNQMVRLRLSADDFFYLEGPPFSTSTRLPLLLKEASLLQPLLTFFLTNKHSPPARY